MTLTEARTLAAALLVAADAAESRGETTIDALDALGAADDAARAELERAIEAAKKA